MIGSLVTNPRDKRLLDNEQYGAIEIAPASFWGMVRAASKHGAKIVDASDLRRYTSDVTVDNVDITDVQDNTTAMLSTGSGERFPLGNYEMVALRFIVAQHAVTLLYVEDYHSPYPCIVDGHITDRRAAISAWIGEGDTSEYTDLILD